MRYITTTWSHLSKKRQCRLLHLTFPHGEMRKLVKKYPDARLTYAIDDERILQGWILLTPNSNYTSRIDIDVYVRARSRGKGIASKLIERMMKRMPSGIYTSVMVCDHDEQSCIFYKNCAKRGLFKPLAVKLFWSNLIYR